MDSKQTVTALYGAYGTGDADQIAGLLHDEVVWTAPAGNATQVALGLGRPEDAGPPRGANDLDRDAIVAFMAYNFARFFGDVDNEFRTVVVEGDVVVGREVRDGGRRLTPCEVQPAQVVDRVRGAAPAAGLRPRP